MQYNPNLLNSRLYFYFMRILQDSYKAYSNGIFAYYETGEFALSREYFIHAYEQTVQKYAPKPDPEFTR